MDSQHNNTEKHRRFSSHIDLTPLSCTRTFDGPVASNGATNSRNQPTGRNPGLRRAALQAATRWLHLWLAFVCRAATAVLPSQVGARLQKRCDDALRGKGGGRGRALALSLSIVSLCLLTLLIVFFVVVPLVGIGSSHSIGSSNSYQATRPRVSGNTHVKSGSGHRRQLPAADSIAAELSDLLLMGGGGDGKGKRRSIRAASDDNLGALARRAGGQAEVSIAVRDSDVATTTAKEIMPHTSLPSTAQIFQLDAAVPASRHSTVASPMSAVYAKDKAKEGGEALTHGKKHIDASSRSSKAAAKPKRKRQRGGGAPLAVGYLAKVSSSGDGAAAAVSVVAPQIGFDRVFTAPLSMMAAVEEGTTNEGISLSKVELEEAFDRNAILRLYRRIAPSGADAASAIIGDGVNNDDDENGNKKNRRTTLPAVSAFFDLMDRSMYSLSPRRVGGGRSVVGEADAHHAENDVHAGPAALRAGTARGFWDSHRPLLKSLLQRYQTFHREALARLRRRAAGLSLGGDDGGGNANDNNVEDKNMYDHFVIVRPVGQLCNRLVAIGSAFLFALMTRRALLIDDGDFYCSLDDLFAAPGMEWVLTGLDNHHGGGEAGNHPFLPTRSEEQRAAASSEDGGNGGGRGFEGFLADFGAIADDFTVDANKMRKRNGRADGIGIRINARYGYAPRGNGAGIGVGMAPQFRPDPHSALRDAFSRRGNGQLAEFTIANPEAGVWPEAEALLCAGDYRHAYASGIGSPPSVVLFNVNQYVVPYFYRNPRYHKHLAELFGVAPPSKFVSGNGQGGEGEAWAMAARAGEDLFHPIAHFLFRPLPALLSGRDEYIKRHFFDRLAAMVSAEAEEEQRDAALRLVPSFVVGLQVRAGGDFTGNAMAAEDWRLYRDCALQASTPDVLLPAYGFDGSDGNRLDTDDGDGHSKKLRRQRRFKLFVATDTEKGRAAARKHLAVFPARARNPQSPRREYGDIISSGDREDASFEFIHEGNAADHRPVPMSDGSANRRGRREEVGIPILTAPGDFLLSNNPQGVRAALLDLLLLASSDDRVHTAWSSYGYFAAAMAGRPANLVTNRAPAADSVAPPDGLGGVVVTPQQQPPRLVSSEGSEWWWREGGPDSSQLALLHAPTMARHRGTLAVAASGEGASSGGTTVSAAVLEIGDLPSDTSDTERRRRELTRLSDGDAAARRLYAANRRAIDAHGQLLHLSLARSIGGDKSGGGFAVRVAGENVPPIGVSVGEDEKGMEIKEGGAHRHRGGGARSADEQRYMGVMHKSDRRAQCVRLPTAEPCFHKFESWGASSVSCYDWRRVTFPEMLRGGRYC